jgi:hypothetical protein
MNSGTAEQEQNGVTMPRPAAIALPAPRRLPASSARVRSGEKKVWMTPITKTTPAQEQHLGRVVGEEMHRLAEAGLA